MVNIKPLLEYYGKVLLEHSEKLKIRSYYKEWDVGYYYTLLKDGIVKYDEEIQRFFVWDLPRKCLWIESLILGFPVPPIFLMQIKEHYYMIIDGLQRTMTIREFIENKFPLSYVSIPELRGRKFSNLPPELIRRFKSAHLPIIVIEPPEDELAKLTMIEIFRRLNLGSKRLTLRQLMFTTLHTECMMYIKLLAQDKHFYQLLRFTESEIKNMYNRWLALGIFASLYAKKPLNTTSAGTNLKEVSEYVFRVALCTDREKCKTLYAYSLNLIKEALRRGFNREHFMLRTYNISRKSHVSSMLLNFILMLIYYDKRDVITPAVIGEFIRKNADTFKELSRSASQRVLDNLFTEAYMLLCK